MAVRAELCSRCRIGFSEASKHGVFDRSEDGFHNDNQIRSPCVDQLSWSELRCSGEERNCPVCMWVVTEARQRFHSAKVAEKDANAAPIRRAYFALEGDTFSWDRSKLMRSVRLRSTLWRRADGLVNMSVLFERISDDDIDTFKYALGRNTGDEVTTNLVRGWVKICESSHTRCHEIERVGWVPTRLVRVMTADDGTLRAVLELATTGKYEISSQYATLSHRWLPDEALRLTRATLSTFSNEIPVSMLKRSILDALSLTIQLGLTYIWIDTLCIIQDDNEDRTREIPIMHRIYGHSYCTIAASDATKPDQGCFWSRSRTPLRSYDVAIDLDGDNHDSLYRIRQNWSKGQKQLRKASLDSRAWVFQERFLSRRVLHYTSRQVQWECRELEASETYPVGAPLVSSYTTSYSGNRALYRPQWNDHPERLQRDTTGEPAPFWSEIVQQYTKRSLTFLGDRLHGLAGVAAHCRELYSDQYRFGLWEKDLPVDLLWRTASSSLGTRLPHIAPSWSWAHVSTPVVFESPYVKPNDQVFAQFICCDLEHNSMGIGVDTKLLLTASLVEGRLDDCDTISAEDFIDIAFDDPDRGDRSRIITMDTSDKCDAKVSYMHIVGRMPSGADGQPANEQMECHGLVLELVESGKLPVFRRIGYYFQRGVPDMSRSQMLTLS